jgi:ABC-type phosphate transport system substrate-binding protein
MRTSIAGAAILLAGVGATTAAAVTSGNNLALNGSDTLYDVTRDVITACGTQFPGASGFASKGITYVGGGSGVGAGQMDLGAQDIAPMSRAMKSGEFCSLTPADASDLLVGIDGVAIVTSKNSNCSTPCTGAPTAAAACANMTTQVTCNADLGCTWNFTSSTCSGTNPASCSGASSIEQCNGTPGCSGYAQSQVGKASFVTSSGTYTLGATTGIDSSIDALRLVFMGIDQTGVQNCASPARKALIANWTNLFATDPSCGGGDAHCSSGITHAWRRSDTSGTTDGFIGVLTAVNGAGTALATMSTAPVGGAQKKSPFCNTFEANDPNHQAQYLDGTATLSDGITTTAMSDGHVNDEEDHDPIRTPCDANDTICGASGQCFAQTTQAACVATSAQCQWNSTTSKCSTTNDMGVVLTIFLPDLAYANSEFYPTTACSGSCALVPVITGGALPPGYLCQNGSKPIAGRCWVPVVDTTGKDPRCLITDPTTRCFGTPGSLGQIDGRVWNRNTMVLTSEVASAYRFAGATYQVALDRNNRLMDGSFYRQHMQTPSSYNARVVDANYTGTCLENDDTSQIGCLADADDCSTGYAGREAARTYPGASTGAPLDSQKALYVHGVSPFTPDALSNLVATSGTVYELARRLYVATGPTGTTFNTLPANSGELELAQCFSKDSLVDTAISAHGYLPIPSGYGGVQCLAYDTSRSTTQPLVNVQGTGNIALPGCALGSNTNTACAGVTAANGFLFGN